MGLRCLLSHDFGEPELEREREERGDEVIITVNEVKTCTRCGERRVVSENTEVTSLDQLTETAADETVPEPPAADDQAPPEAAADDSEPAAASSVSIDDTDPTVDDAEVLTDDEPEDLGTATTANMTVDDVEAAAAEPADPGDDGPVEPTDDGVILDDEPDEHEDADEADREPGEWPEYESREGPTGEDGREWPDPEVEDEGFDAEEPTDPPEDMTFGGGFTPEITDGDVSVEEGDDQLTFTRAEEATVEYEPTVDDIQTEFYCPECGLAREAGNSSMRAGDICPECKRGYISERPHNPQ